MARNSTSDSNQVVSNLLTLLDTLDLTQTRHDPDIVHRLRVAIKQTRAWLRLCRGLIGNTASYEQLVAKLRIVSNSLAGQRDQDVALQTLAKLARKYPGNKAQHLIGELSQAITSHRPPSPATGQSLSALVDSIRQELPAFLSLAVSVETQQAGLRRGYKKMCKLGQTALKSEHCTDLHAWRKRVKSLGYQLPMAGIHEAGMEKLRVRITRLGNKLGKIHDLCFLQSMIDELTSLPQDDQKLGPLYKRIERERQVLLKTIRKHHRHVCHHPLPWLSLE